MRKLGFVQSAMVLMLLVGGANGKHVGGKNLTLPQRTPLANLHLTMLDKLGIKQDKFGNSTGLLSEV